MATYMTQFTYSTASIKGLVNKPQDRRGAAEKIFSSAGGKLIEMYFSFGEFDGMAVVEFPSNVDAASALLAVGASGAFSNMKTTVLITTDEAVRAMQKAQGIVQSYVPPSG